MRRILTISAVLAAATLGAARPAAAQSIGLTGGTSVSKEPPRFYGLTLGYSLWDASGLNTVNYQNNIGMLIEPTWNFGKLLFRETRFV
ncbi:MAG: hypothetical protein FJZ00_11115, partial [Candidatus Sericytochromatia bacterium]|nr:hypothetical protein [Candidatus Tanganyikabacteria bacterium]